MATTITQICCAIPTAVMTESSEKMMSSTTIWHKAQPSRSAPWPAGLSSDAASTLWWIS
jgi:hypothetical protein